MPDEADPRPRELLGIGVKTVLRFLSSGALATRLDLQNRQAELAFTPRTQPVRR